MKNKQQQNRVTKTITIITGLRLHDSRDRETDTERHRDRDTERHRGRQTETDTERHRDRDTERDRGRQRQIQRGSRTARQRETDRERQRDRERWCCRSLWINASLDETKKLRLRVPKVVSHGSRPNDVTTARACQGDGSMLDECLPFCLPALH